MDTTQVSRQFVEVLGSESFDTQVSRQFVEVLGTPFIPVDASSLITLSQVGGVTGLYSRPITSTLNVTQVVTYILHRLPTINFDTQVSRQFVEVLGTESFDTQVSRQFVEVLGTPCIPVDASSLITLSQVGGVTGLYTRPITSTLNVTQVVTYILHRLPTINSETYGTISEANEYFAQRLHERAWTNSKPADRTKALWAATLIIDVLNFKGDKHSESQYLEFPRDDDTEVPTEIRLATYEVAQSLLDGKDPDEELENLGVISQGMGSVRTSYSRAQVPVEHIINGVPSPQAWRWLKPFLRDDVVIVLSRTC